MIDLPVYLLDTLMLDSHMAISITQEQLQRWCPHPAPTIPNINPS